MLNDICARVRGSWRVALAAGAVCLTAIALCARWLHLPAQVPSELISAMSLGAMGLFVAALLISNAREDARRRAHWLEVIAYPPIPIDAVTIDAGHAPALPRSRSGQREPASPYVRRSVHDDLTRGLSQDRWVVVRGERGAGVSRTILEAVRAASPPLESLLLPLMAAAAKPGAPLDLFAVDLPSKARRGEVVLWLTTLDDRFIRDELDISTVERFLARHPNLTIVFELELVAGSPTPNPGGRPHGPFEALATAAPRNFLVRRELVGDELAEAARLYARVPENRRRFLPEYLTSYDEHVRRLRLPNIAGAAIVSAAIDWKHCGSARGAPERFLRAACSYYMPDTRAPVSDHDFERGIRWAAESFLPGRALLTRGVDEGEWEPAPVLVNRGWRGAVQLPIEVWELIRVATADRPGELIAVGDAAHAADETEIARNLWTFVEEWGTDSDARTASARRRAVVDQEATLHGRSVIPRLLERTATRGVREALTLQSPPAVRLEGERGEGLFDPRQPASDRTRFDGYYATLYRYRTLRFGLRVIVLLLLDILAICAGVSVALAVQALLDGADVSGLAPATWFALSLTIPAIAVAGGYRHDTRCARLDRLTLALSVAAILSTLVGAAHGEDLVESITIWASFAVVLPLCYFARALYDAASRWWVRDHGLHTRMLFVGPGSNVRQAAFRVRHTRGRPTTLVGYVSDEEQADASCLGAIGDLEHVLEQYRIHQVVVADPTMPLVDVLALFQRCQLHEVRVDKMLSIDEMRVYDKRIPIGETIALQQLQPLALGPWSVALKRAFDIVVGSAVLVGASPLMAAISLLLLARDGKPVLVRAYVPGRGHETFGLLKFRTTATGETGGPPRGGASGGFGAGAEATRLGEIMRRYGLDELPQLVNVVRGDMSLVGPRPLGIEHYDRMEAWHRLRYVVRPGLTGGWQISRGRTWVSYDEMVLHDLVYLRGWSLWRDCEIVLMTPIAVVRQARQGGSAPDSP